MVLERGTEAEAVTAGGIDMQSTAVASPPHGGVVGYAVGDGVYQFVVVGSEDDGGWCMVALNGIIVGKLLYQLLVVNAFFAKKVMAGACMCLVFVH